jgi:CO/xanthine dehydrogenase FAD-binding subunit
MRAYLPGYQLIVPRNLRDALSLLAEAPGTWRPFAGGTDLMVLFEAGRLEHLKYISIWNLRELRGIEETTHEITLGALTSYTDVRRSETMQREFPMLCQAASETGGIAIQNRGTIGGNIVNGSPAADSPPALLAYGAEVELVSKEGSRWVDYSEFHIGYKQSVMRPDELLSRIRLPRPSPDAIQFYRKVGTRRAQAISKVCFAGYAEATGSHIREIRLAFGSVAPVVLRCRRTEAQLRGRDLTDKTKELARAELAREIVPIDDLRSTERYRLRVAMNLLDEFVTQIKNS